MIFTIPMERFNDFMLGMRKITEAEDRLTRLPIVHEMKPEPQPPDSYYRMAQLMGMDIKKPE
jgi:hypothetical protein